MKTRRINQVRAGAITSYITIFFNIVSGFIYTPWLIKQLGQSDYAIYTLVTSVMTYFVLDFGMGAAITRFIARYRANGEEYKIKQLLGVTAKLYLLLDGVILVALVVFYNLVSKIYVNLSADEIYKLKIVFLIAGSVSLLSFPLLPLNGIYTAYEKLYAQKLFDLVTKVISVSAVVIALLSGGGLFNVVLFNTSIAFLMQLIKLIYITKSEKLTIDIRYKDVSLLKSIFSFSVWVTIATVADRFFFTFVPSLLGIVSNTAEIAIFGVALSVENYTALFASAFSNLFLPRVTRMVVEKKDPEVITDLMIKVGRIQLIVVSAIVVLMVSMGKEFVRCWVGDDYEKSYYVIVLIILPCLVHFTQAIANEMIYATNNVKYRALVYAVGSIISIITTLTLGRLFGAIGAGIGIALALILSHVILMNYIYYKKMGLNVIRYFKECHLKMYGPLILSGIVGYTLMRLFPVSRLILFLAKAIVWGVIHTIILWTLVMNGYEKDIFKGYIRRLIPNPNK